MKMVATKLRKKKKLKLKLLTAKLVSKRGNLLLHHLQQVLLPSQVDLDM